jgi:hypothetical protein
VGIGNALDREATRLYGLGGLDETRGATPAALAEALLGTGAIRELPEGLLPYGGALARVGPSWRVYIQRGLRPSLARFTVMHELAHWALGRDATEDHCDALAARLLAPKPAFERALSETGASYTRLARWFGCTETFAALRYGEVTDAPLVVVAPATVRIRGRTWSWPKTETELRGLAKARKRPGISKARLRDDPRRVALRVG